MPNAADRLCIVVAWSRHGQDVFVERQTPVQKDSEYFDVIGYGRSTPATFTDIREDAERSWLPVPIRCNLLV